MDEVRTIDADVRSVGSDSGQLAGILGHEERLAVIDNFSAQHPGGISGLRIESAVLASLHGAWTLHRSRGCKRPRADRKLVKMIVARRRLSPGCTPRIPLQDTRAHGRSLLSTRH